MPLGNSPAKGMGGASHAGHLPTHLLRCQIGRGLETPDQWGDSGWDVTGGILTYFGLEDEAFRYFPGWTLRPQGAKNSTCGLQYETQERVNTWRRSSGLQPREVKRQHMYLHMSRHPRGSEELILTPPLPPCCRPTAPALLPVVSVQNLKKEKKTIAVPEMISVNYSLQMPAGQWKRCFFVL